MNWATSFLHWNVGRKLNTPPEDAARMATKRFTSRFHSVERKLEAAGIAFWRGHPRTDGPPVGPGQSRREGREGEVIHLIMRDRLGKGRPSTFLRSSPRGQHALSSEAQPAVHQAQRARNSAVNWGVDCPSEAAARCLVGGRPRPPRPPRPLRLTRLPRRRHSPPQRQPPRRAPQRARRPACSGSREVIPAATACRVTCRFHSKGSLGTFVSPLRGCLSVSGPLSVGRAPPGVSRQRTGRNPADAKQCARDRKGRHRLVEPPGTAILQAIAGTSCVVALPTVAVVWPMPHVKST